jgi:hypothetical protein
MNANQLIESAVDDVVRHVDRKRRNDVGVELALLTDELQGQAATAERASRPGNGDDAAAPVRPAGGRRAALPEAGFPIIEPADGPAFVRLTAIGMAAVWILGWSTFRHGGGPGTTGPLVDDVWPRRLLVAGLPRRLCRHGGLGPAAVSCRRQWQPRVVDRDRINRPAWVLAIAASTLGVVWLTSPAQFVEQITGGRLAPQFYGSLVYDATFRQWRLPLLLALLDHASAAVCGARRAGPLATAHATARRHPQRGHCRLARPPGRWRRAGSFKVRPRTVLREAPSPSSCSS